MPFLIYFYVFLFSKSCGTTGDRTSRCHLDVTMHVSNAIYGKMLLHRGFLQRISTDWVGSATWPFKTIKQRTLQETWSLPHLSVATPSRCPPFQTSRIPLAPTSTQSLSFFFFNFESVFLIFCFQSLLVFWILLWALSVSASSFLFSISF